ncbi:hypothetical protein WNY78_01165 [Psychroserpens sp. AS72]|uniref:hypothetical protein n=1 Tax=Psychroserpens sp. AS72 TaxID=3135775 RepID=UPI0031793BC3
MKFTLKKYDKVLFVFFGASLIASFLIWTFEERFDQDDWESNTEKRYQMADDIIDSEMLIGKSKEDIIDVLGLPYKSNLYGKDNIAYRLGRPPSFSESKRTILIIDFELDHAVQVIQSIE